MVYKLSNEIIEIKVKSFGAELSSLKKVNEEYEYIWQADEKYWNRHSPILFPIVGKLINDTYTYKEKEYKLTQHGFARDKEFELFNKTDNSICFKLNDDEDSLKKYPFKFELFVTYTLVNKSVKISYAVKNKNNTEMYFSIGSHPAFNWEEEKEDKQHWYLNFQEENTLSSFFITKDGISNNKIDINLESNKLILNEELFLNDALILDNLRRKNISLINSKNQREIKIKFDDCEYLGIWSKPNGSPFICIEPWNGIADFINHNQKIEEKLGIKKLEKGETFNTEYIIQI